MLSHVSIGVRDVDRAKRFYDEALRPLGYTCIRAARSMVGYGYGADTIFFWIVAAERPVPADEKSRLHFCFAALTPAAFDAFYAAALQVGAATTASLAPAPSGAQHAGAPARQVRLARCLSRILRSVLDNRRRTVGLAAPPAMRTDLARPWVPDSGAGVAGTI
jgi:catechol 2,3-dioxygenase-like lactoylglutathione lyase family enzyme